MNRIAFISMASLFAACSSSDKPTAEAYDDTAQAIGSTVATGGGGGDVASMADSVSLAFGAMPFGLAVQADGHIGGNRLGVDYTYTAACKDAAGAVLATCDSTTDEAQIDVAWSGALETSNLDASVTRDGAWRIAGLQGDTATLTGDSSFAFDTELRSIFRPGATARLSFAASATYDVQISTQDRTIVDGAATLDVTAHRVVTGTDRDVDKTFEIDAEIGFSAARTAELVLDGSERFTLDLTTGVVVRVN